jgi:hypothetical protein
MLLLFWLKNTNEAVFYIIIDYIGGVMSGVLASGLVKHGFDRWFKQNAMKKRVKIPKE